MTTGKHGSEAWICKEKNKEKLETEQVKLI
jgi:hypothetical protein